MNTGIDDVGVARDAFVIENVKFTSSERRSNFVFDDFNLDPIADNFFAGLNLSCLPDLDSHRRIEFQSHASGSRLGISEHNPYLHSQLIDKNNGSFGLGNDRRQFSQSMGHQASLQAHMLLIHLSFYSGPRSQGGDRINDTHISPA